MIYCCGWESLWWSMLMDNYHWNGIIWGYWSDAFLLWNMMMKILCSHRFLWIITNINYMIMMDHYDCNELLWVTVMIIMGWKGSHQARDDNDDREPSIDAGYGHVWYQWYPVFLRGERHKGWYPSPDGFDFDVEEKSANCCKWFSGMWRE